MNSEGKQIDAWRGDFGDAYVDRNAADGDRVRNNIRAFREIFGHIDDHPPQTILEVGANIGANLRALSEIMDAELYAVEPNETAREILVRDAVVPAERAVDAVATALPFDDDGVDMVFTAGVLIHVSDDRIEEAYREIYRVAARYLLSLEYFSPPPARISYRGETDLLFKRDFGGLWLDLFPKLKPVADGFFWKRTTGLDNVNWWLFEKP